MIIFGVDDSGNHQLFDVEDYAENRKNTQM